MSDYATHHFGRYTYRVVVTYSDKAGFTGASGLYPSHPQAWKELWMIARTWEGLAEPQWLRDDEGNPTQAFTVYPKNLPAQTYSILQERI